MALRNELGRRIGDLFAQVNEFMGHHTECSREHGEAATYRVGCTSGTSDCSVTVSCICGASRSLAARRSEARDLVAITQQYDIPVIEM
jgi:hypothetical protein